MPIGWEEALETPADTTSGDFGSSVHIEFDRDAGYVAPDNPFSPLGAVRTRDYDPGRFTAPPPIFPTVVVLPTPSEPGVPTPPSPGDEAVVVFEEDPDDYRQTGIPSSTPGGPIFMPRSPSVLDRPVDYPYGSIPPIPDDVGNVAVDWGSLFGNVASSYVAARYAPSPVRGLVAAQPSQSGFINQYTAPAAAPAAAVMAGGNGCATCPTGAPRYSKICNATGEVSPLRRRRRRRLLTAGDLSDIASLKAIVGGGAALNAAVVKAMK